MSDQIVFFPDATEVFSRDVSSHAEYLLPIASIDGSLLDESINERLHFIQPIEPYDGYAGDETEKYHTHYCRTNWVGYQIEGSKCYMLAEFEYFQKRYIKLHPEFRSTFEGVEFYLSTLPEDIEKHYSRTRQEYENAKKDFASGKMTAQELKSELNTEDGPFNANWSNDSSFPLETVESIDSKGSAQDLFYPTNRKGNKFRHIGSLGAWAFSAGACTLHLFYDPEEKIILNTFDWT